MRRATLKELVLRVGVIAAALTAALATGLIGAPFARGQTAAGGDDLPDVVRIKVTDPTRELIRMAVASAPGSESGAVSDVLQRDLEIVGYSRILDRKSFLANLTAEGLGITPADWTNIGAQWVTKSRGVGSGQLEFRLYQPSKSAEPVLARTASASSPAEIRRRTHEWAAQVVKFITGEDSFFGTRLAFAATGRGVREIYAMDFDGGAVTRLSGMNSVSLLPAWSPSGGEIAFTSFARENPDLWIISAAGGRARRVARYPGLNTGPAWSPDGSKIALTLSRDGNAEIYLVRPADGSIIARLTSDRAIDTSPSWSPDGSQIAFVSDRQGSPQVYVMSARGGAARRVTFRGNYNQTPKWCPRADTPLIAFSGRDEKNRYDIFTADLRNGNITRLTQGFGSNLDPTWAPNGRRLAFVNTGKGGVWIVNPDGSNPVQIYRGGASGLAWGPGR